MRLQSQPVVIEHQWGRGCNQTLVLLGQNRATPAARWLVRVRYSTKRKVWLVTRGGPLALARVVGSKPTYDEARALTHAVALLPDAGAGRLPAEHRVELGDLP